MARKARIGFSARENKRTFLYVNLGGTAEARLLSLSGMKAFLFFPRFNLKDFKGAMQNEKSTLQILSFRGPNSGAVV